MGVMARALATRLEVDAGRLAALCERYQVSRLSVFGSASRGEMGPESDIDVLVEFRTGTRTGLVEFAGLMLALTEMWGRRVDLVSRAALRPALRERILGEAQLLYAAG